MRHGIVLFHTTTSALRAEKTLQKADLTVKLVPTPRELSSDCGIALRFTLLDEPTVRQTLSLAGLEYEVHYMD